MSQPLLAKGASMSASLSNSPRCAAVLEEVAKGKIFGALTAKAGAKTKAEPKGKRATAPAA